MWSNTSETALDLTPEPSRRLAWLLTVIHLLAISGLLAASLWIGIVSLPLLVVSLIWHLRHLGWLGGCMAVTRVRVEPNGNWRVLDSGGRWARVRVSSDSFCAGTWCIVRMRTANTRHVLVMAEDSVDARSLRRVRACLLAVRGDVPASGRDIRAAISRLGILADRSFAETQIMPTDQERLESLLSDDPDHIYTDEELDAIEAIDAEMALRIDRVQTLARREGEGVVADGPVDEVRVREAVEEARRILMQDGGDIEFVAVEGRTVRVRLKGACAGCPRATLDLRNVVERLVRSREPAVAKVENEF
jgi:toxin CptA